MRLVEVLMLAWFQPIKDTTPVFLPGPRPMWVDSEYCGYIAVDLELMPAAGGKAD